MERRLDVDATLDHGLSNGLIESTNTKIRVLTRMAFGFTKPEALVALAMLAFGGYYPPLPGRATKKMTHRSVRGASFDKCCDHRENPRIGIRTKNAHPSLVA
jgi:hypothetical protein